MRAIGVLRHPQAVGIILEREQLKLGRVRGCHRSEAMPLGEVINAGNDKRVGALQIVRTDGPATKRHWIITPSQEFSGRLHRRASDGVVNNIAAHHRTSFACSVTSIAATSALAQADMAPTNYLRQRLCELASDFDGQLCR